MVDIEHACAEHLLKEKERDSARPNVHAHKQTEDQFFEKMAEWMEKYPYVQPEMKIGDRILWLTHFLEGDVFVAPYIMTIDEWFEQNDQ